MKFVYMHKIIVSVAMIGLQFGCTVGPDFNRPAKPEVATYTATPFPAHTAAAPTALGGAQRFIEGGVVNPQWWRDLGSPKLDALIEEALRASPTLAKAQA
ncbi:MAG: RND transporter, partial [Desulfofustis sp.]|nr:RND transporter [Desulfofustis sp.]